MPEYTGFISGLVKAAEVTRDALLETSVPDGSTETGFTSKAVSVNTLSSSMLNAIEYETELETEAKKIIPAINEAANIRAKSFSETPFDTGKKWIGGKPIYGMWINWGALPDNEWVYRDIPFAGGIDKVVSMGGICYNDSQSFNIPLPSPSTPIILFCTNNIPDAIRVNVQTTSNRTGLNAYIYIEFTV